MWFSILGSKLSLNQEISYIVHYFYIVDFSPTLPKLLGKKCISLAISCFLLFPDRINFSIPGAYDVTFEYGPQSWMLLSSSRSVEHFLGSTICVSLCTRIFSVPSLGF